MDGSYLLTINPAVLDDESLWSYADLQKLCKLLELKASGKRQDLIMRLLEWHKTRTELGTSLVKMQDAEDYPLNVDGSNFSILSVNVRPRSPGVTTVPSAAIVPASSCAVSPVRSPMRRAANGTPVDDLKKVASLVGLSDNSPLVVSPTLLRPLAPTTPVRTPSKSALKAPGSEGKASRIKFSPYNGTKVIPNRRDEHKGIHAQHAEHEREFYRSNNSPNTNDEDSLDDEEEYLGDEQARINTERNVFVCSSEDCWRSEF